MPKNDRYLPEGLRPKAIPDLTVLRAAHESGAVLEGTVSRCGTDRTLYVSLGDIEGILPREEAQAPWISGAARDISLLSCVGNPVCFHVTEISADAKGAPRILLSRRSVQENACRHFLQHYTPGSIVTARVTHLESFGAFVDIGCGIIALLPIENISVSRIQHPGQRFSVGQKILAAVASVDPAIPRFTMTHKELLGTWLENASRFLPGETVHGIVRAVKEYGCFVELTPNLSGLADIKDGVREGDRVSVYIKNIRPERMKVKLQIIRRLPEEEVLPPIRYTMTDGVLDRWVYSPPGCEKPVMETIFTSP